MGGQDYPLHDVWLLRQRREDAARRQRDEASRAVTVARQTAEKASRECQTYRLWREGEEQHRYEAIRGQRLRREALETYRQGLADLKLHEESLREVEKDAAFRLQEALVQEEEARQQYLRTLREHERLAQHRQQWLEEARKQTEHHEENTLTDGG